MDLGGITSCLDWLVSILQTFMDIVPVLMIVMCVIMVAICLMLEKWLTAIGILLIFAIAYLKIVVF